MEIYHYCSEKTFINIITSKKLWLTPVECMNDRDEIIHLYNNVWKNARKILLKKYTNDDCVNKILKIVDEHIDIIAKNIDMPYCTCFSDEGDLLHQWRLYADDGRGFSICFDSELLGIKQSPPHPNVSIENAIGIGKVVYNFQNQVSILYNIVSQLLNKRQNNALDWLNIVANLKYYSAVFKKQSYYTERERRIIYYFSKDHKFRDSFISGPYKFKEGKQRFNFNWYTSENKHCIKKIFLGPQNPYSEEDIKNILFKNGIFIGREKIFRSNLYFD